MTLVQLSENRTWRNDMEKWTKIKPDFIPFGDYGIEINIDGDTLIAYLEDSEKFKFTFTNVWAFRSVYESLELIDSYWEQGLAKNRPLYLTNYIYEVENAEFGDLVASANIANKKLHHYKLISGCCIRKRCKSGESY